MSVVAISIACGAVECCSRLPRVLCDYSLECIAFRALVFGKDPANARGCLAFFCLLWLWSKEREEMKKRLWPNEKRQEPTKNEDPLWNKEAEMFVAS